MRGEPYQQPALGIDCNRTLVDLAASSDYIASLPGKLGQVKDRLQLLQGGNMYQVIDRKIKDGENLSFDEAFQLITAVCAPLNNPLYAALEQIVGILPPRETLLLQATSLLSAMSTKEALVGLTSEEIAGMVAATIHLDTVVRPYHADPVLAFGGMGGDKGYNLGDDISKLFSLSTLSSLVLATDGFIHKHHSYPNTSKIAGQSAIEAYGARSDFSSQGEMEQILQDTGLLMTSCHNTRTLHTLSHRLRGETINHVIGPLAFTLSPDTPIHAFVGVNEKVHPQTIVEALRILHGEGFQTYTDSAVYCGTDLEEIPEAMLDPQSYSLQRVYKQHIRLDEIAPPPYASLVSFFVAGENKGTYMVSPEDFYSPEVLEDCRFEDLLIPNQAESIFSANRAAMLGEDKAKTMYLAMTVGLGLFTRYCLRLPDALNSTTHKVNKAYLQTCTMQALEILQSGKAVEKLHEYVLATGGIL